MPFFEIQRFYQIGYRAPETEIVKSIEMRMENYAPIFLLFVQITFIEIAHSLSSAIDLAASFSRVSWHIDLRSIQTITTDGFRVLILR